MPAPRSVLGVVLFTISTIACAPAAPVPVAHPPAPVMGVADADAALHEYLSRTVAFGVSGAFLVARNGRIVLHEGYGLADRERGIPVTAETVFDIGSITKQFTAAAILKLEEHGRLRVEDSIGRFFPGVPADKQGITLHHLLTHTSGLIGDLGGDYQIMPRDTLVRLALASELQWAPDTRWDYSNLGYSLLGAIVEIASGQPYERFLHEQLFTPVGMSKTGYRIPQWTARELAVGYEGSERWGTPLDHAWAADGPWWNLRANGGILSTMGDMYRWHRALESDAVLSAASREKLFTPHVAENLEGGVNYGYGWGVFTTPRNTRLIGHTGGNGYFFADFQRYVDEGVVVILATNDASQRIELAQDRILSALFSGRAPTLPPAATAQLSPAELERYAGSYMLPSGARVVVRQTAGRLTATPAGQQAAELLTNPPAPVAPELRELNARAIAALESAQREDFSVLRAASASPDRSQAILQRIWRTAEQNMGPFRTVEVMGTVMSWWDGTPEPVTFVRLHFERGARLFRFHWRDGKIAAYGGFAIPSPAPTTLLPQGEHRFVGYNLGIERPIRMRFEGEGDAAAASLVIETPDGVVLRAVRETQGESVGGLSPQDEFWRQLHALCPAAAEGQLLRAPEGDTQIDPGARLVVHFWECGESELRFPLHVGDNRSRTWVFIRHADSLELRHDHRHPDGTEESTTWYGASTRDQGTGSRQEFVFERDGMLVGWRVEIEPGRRFTYGTIRDGAWRHHMEFDLTSPVAAPPLPWGHQTRPSQRPAPAALPSSPVHEAAPAAGSAEAVRFVTSDIPNFWRAFDAASGADSVARVRAFHGLYLAPGSAGLRDWTVARLMDQRRVMAGLERAGKSPEWVERASRAARGSPLRDSLERLALPEAQLSAAEALARVTARYPRYYAGVRERTLALDTSTVLRRTVRDGLRRLAALYPEARFRDVYFVIGRLTSGGTTGESGMLIGAELSARGPTTPMDELPPSVQVMTSSLTPEQLGHLVVHETVHTLQAPLRDTTLLAATLREGTADFLATLATGIRPEWTVYFRYGSANEAAVWQAFKREMHGSDRGNWLYNYGAAQVHGAPDLGYWVGYRIAEAYYERAADKQTAVRELLAGEDPSHILAFSQYAP